MAIRKAVYRQCALIGGAATAVAAPFIGVSALALFPVGAAVWFGVLAYKHGGDIRG